MFFRIICIFRNTVIILESLRIHDEKLLIFWSFANSEEKIIRDRYKAENSIFMKMLNLIMETIFLMSIRTFEFVIFLRKRSILLTLFQNDDISNCYNFLTKDLRSTNFILTFKAFTFKILHSFFFLFFWRRTYVIFKEIK